MNTSRSTHSLFRRIVFCSLPALGLSLVGCGDTMMDDSTRSDGVTPREAIDANPSTSPAPGGGSTTPGTVIETPSTVIEPAPSTVDPTATPTIEPPKVETPKAEDVDPDRPVVEEPAPITPENETTDESK